MPGSPSPEGRKPGICCQTGQLGSGTTTNGCNTPSEQLFMQHCQQTVRIIPSFRIALEIEKEEWKPFCNALDKKTKRSLMGRCLIFLDYTSQLAPILFSM